MTTPLRPALELGPSGRSIPDVNRTARAIMRPTLLEAPTLNIRQGQVKAVNVAAQRADITLGGGDVVVTGVAHGSNYRPAVNDVVWVFTFGTDLLIYDRVGAFGPSVVQDAAEAVIGTVESRTSTAFGNLTTVGPTLTAVVSPSGRMLIGVGAACAANVAAEGGFMGVQLSGANTLPPVAESCLANYTGTAQSYVAASKVGLYTGLTPGATTVQAKYATIFGGSVSWARRQVWVLPL